MILDTIFNNRIISRVEIAKKLAMSKPAVNEYIDRLLARRIIVEMGEGDTTVKGGRKPILLSPNPDYRYIIALDLNYTKPVVALGSITGNPLDKFFINQDFEALTVCETVSSYINAMISRNKITHDQIGAIVISTPGIVDRATGDIILNPQHEALHTISLKGYLSDLYKLPIIIKNDVNMAAIGEAKFLQSEGRDTLFFISCGIGLGSALIWDGELYEGAHCSAGEINYYVFDEDGGRIEDQVSINGLIRRISRMITREGADSSLIPYEMSFSDIVSAYKQKEPVVFKAIKEIGRRLGMVVSNSVALIDVNTVVLGGDYVVFKDVLIPEIQRFIQNSPLVFKPEIFPTALAYAGGIIGCFEIGLKHMLETLETG